jgi:asparagine synthase (glutamine-hydrolysing)
VRREQDYIERARELLDRAVMRAISDLDRVAIATTGGLDSSAIAATAARLGRAGSTTCYTVLPPPDYSVDVGSYRYIDERPKVEALGRLYPDLELRFLAPEGADEFENDDTRCCARLAQPSFGPLHQTWFGAMERTAVAEGHRVLLTGTHGNAGLSWDGKFALSSLLTALDLPLFARELRAAAHEGGRGLAWTLYADALKPLAPSWVHRLVHRLRGRDPDSVSKYGALNPQFIADHDLPKQWRDVGFDPQFGQRAFDARQQRAFVIFDRNQSSRDHMAMYEEACGLEMRDPHADRELLEFCLSVPEWMYRANGVPRAFARNVLADRLPAEILHERRRGMQGGAWFRRLDRNQIAQDIERLEASRTAQRLIDLPRVRRLIDEWPDDEETAEKRFLEYTFVLARALHIGRFIRWVERDNA